MLNKTAKKSCLKLNTVGYLLKSRDYILERFLSAVFPEIQVKLRARTPFSPAGTE